MWTNTASGAWRRVASSRFKGADGVDVEIVKRIGTRRDRGWAARRVHDQHAGFEALEQGKHALRGRECRVRDAGRTESCSPRRRCWFQRVSPAGPKKSARMLLGRALIREAFASDHAVEIVSEEDEEEKGALVADLGLALRGDANSCSAAEPVALRRGSRTEVDDAGSPAEVRRCQLAGDKVSAVLYADPEECP